MERKGICFQQRSIPRVRQLEINHIWVGPTQDWVPSRDDQIGVTASKDVQPHRDVKVATFVSGRVGSAPIEGERGDAGGFAAAALGL